MIRLVQITYVPRLCEYDSEVSSPTLVTVGEHDVQVEQAQ